MTNLRERVAEAIELGAYADLEVGESRQIADAAISAVFDALLSDTAVMAGALGIGQEEQCEFSDDGVPEKCPSDAWLIDEYRETTIAGIKAAMAALTADDAQTGEPQ